MLTDEQIAFFNEFGFLIFRQLFRSEEMGTIGSEAEVALKEIYQGREGGPQSSWVSLLGPSTPFNASLLDDERLYGIATQLFDENIIGLNTEHSNHYRMFNYPIDAPFCPPHRIESAQGNPVRKHWIECLRDLE